MDIATIILAISTIVLVGVTGYYAKQTRNTVNILEKTAELSIRPHLKGTFQQIGPIAGDLMIKNIGNGPANKIELSYWVDGDDSTKRNWIKPLMMPNEFDEFFIPKNKKDCEFNNDYFKNNQTTVRIVGKYFDILDKQYTIDDIIDITAYVKQWENTSVRYQESSDKEIQKELERISSSINSINKEFSGFRRFFENKSDL